MKARFPRLLLRAGFLVLGACSTGSGTTKPPAAPRLVSFPTSDDGLVFANEYGSGERAVVLAHGGRFDKESWEPEARALERAGFRVLAIDFRGYGQSRAGTSSRGPADGLSLDVLASVRHLAATGAKSVSIVGGSMGGGAAADASAAAAPGEIDRLVLIAPAPSQHPERMQGRKLFVTARDDANADGSPRLPRIREEFEKAPGPKEWVVLEGSAHAQYIFDTDQGPRLLERILEFLSVP